MSYLPPLSKKDQNHKQTCFSTLVNGNKEFMSTFNLCFGGDENGIFSKTWTFYYASVDSAAF